MSEKYQRGGRWPADTAERIRVARQRGDSFQRIADEFGCSMLTLRTKAIELGLHRVGEIHNRFTDEEIQTISADYLAGVPVRDIAARLGRSEGVIRQRITHRMRDLVRTRKSSTTKLLMKFGLEAGRLSPDEAADKARQLMVAAKAGARRNAIAAKEARRLERVNHMLNQIASGKSRNEAMFEARACGATLEDIAQPFGLTRERVRQICDQVAFDMAIKHQVKASQDMSEAAE